MSISAIGSTNNWYSSSVYNQNSLTGTSADSSTTSHNHKKKVAGAEDGQSTGMSIMMAMAMMGMNNNPQIKSGETSDSDIKDAITKLKNELTDLSSKLTDNTSPDDLKQVMDQLGQDMQGVPPMVLGQLLQSGGNSNSQATGTTESNSATQTSDVVANLKTQLDSIVTKLGQVSDQDVKDIVANLKETGGMPPMGGNMSYTMVGGTTSTDTNKDVNETTSYKEKLAQET